MGKHVCPVCENVYAKKQIVRFSRAETNAEYRCWLCPECNYTFISVDKIKDISYKYEIIVIYPGEIDHAVNNHDGLNLNRLEARKSAEIINLLKPDKAIIDTPSNNVKSYKQYLSGFVKNKNIL